MPQAPGAAMDLFNSYFQTAQAQAKTAALNAQKSAKGFAQQMQEQTKVLAEHVTENTKILAEQVWLISLSPTQLARPTEDETASHGAFWVCC